MHPNNGQPVDFRPRHLDLTRTQRPSGHLNQNRNDFHTGYGAQQVQGKQLKPQQRMVRRVGKKWDNWPEITLKLINLRADETTWNIWRNFERIGSTIVFIELYETPDGRRDGRGKVRFSAPVHQPFWVGGEFALRNVDDSFNYKIRVELIEPRGNFIHQSTIRPQISYPQVMHMFPKRLHFGLMTAPNSMMSLQAVQPVKKPDDLRFTVDVFRKRFTAQFKVVNNDPRHKAGSNFVSNQPIGRLDRENVYKFQIPFDQLKEIRHVDSKSEGTFKFIISLDSPPTFNRRREEAKDTHDAEALTWSEFDDGWYRQTDVVYDPYSLTTAPIALHKDRPVIDIGRWTTYVFEFNAELQNSENYKNLKQAFEDHNIPIIPLGRLDLQPGRPAQLWSIIDPPQSTADLEHLAEDSVCISLPFEVRYQLDVCISRELLNEYNISREFVDKLAKIALTDVAKARNILEWVAYEGKRIFEPMTVLENSAALAFPSKTDIPHYCAYSRKATITPSTIYFSSPTIETTNRVLRHYSRENLDGRFLRVQFTDETFEGRINSCVKQRNDEVFTRVYRTLANGIRVGDRHYEFLAFGNSQFRENGAYFFCETSNLTCNDIRGWMGNFSHINVPARYAARLGQCFSTTRAISGSAPQLVIIPDIKHNGHNFTDGVGKISPVLGQIIADQLKVNSSHTPSAFQFRLGGCKGILVIWPEAKGSEVHIRESQQKFQAIYNGLEIIRYSRYSCATLNRQTITILSNLGVEDEVFIEMMSEQLSNYQNAMTDDDIAVELLCRYIDDNHMTINIAKMIGSEIKDPFVSSLLHLWRSWSIKLLKEKAKIVVEQGAFVLGCVDETDTLRGYTTPTVSEGSIIPEDQIPQIFIQVPIIGPGYDPKNPVYNVIEGLCLVGRNPSLHPGDLRICQAVNVPALHDLRDVVVFPASGEQDVPSMCSGGDLDGDDYFVIWDKKLQPPEWNCAPMSYAAPPPKAQKNPVQVEDLMKFFVRFMKNDALPSIAHAHLAQSDYLEQGVKDPKCLQLAQLHSKAVDYVKTGHPAEMPKKLRPRQWPHFMEKKYKPKEAIYHSHKVLGQLYDKVQSVDFVPQWTVPFDKRILTAYKLDDAALKSARQIKANYDVAMRRIMAQQEIQTEFEIWSAFVLSKPRVGSDYKVGEEIGRVSEALKVSFRTTVIEAAGGNEFSLLGPFVAGMYKVTKEELDRALAECRATKIVGGREVRARKMETGCMPLISFPWLFENVLERIATGREGFDNEGEIKPQELELKGEQTRKRRAIVPADDAIRQENGLVVHRGELLDIFRSEASLEVFDEDNYEARSQTSESYFFFNNGGGSSSDLGGPDSLPPRSAHSESGSDSIVPQPHVDGFTNRQRTRSPLPKAVVQIRHSSSSSGSLIDVEEAEPISPIGLQACRGSPTQGTVYVDGERTTNAESLALPIRNFSPSYSLLDSPVATANRSSSDDIGYVLLPSSNTATPSKGNEPLDPIGGENLGRIVPAGNFAQDQGHASGDDVEEIIEEEEVVTLDIEETPFEKLARMHGS